MLAPGGQAAVLGGQPRQPVSEWDLFDCAARVAAAVDSSAVDVVGTWCHPAFPRRSEKSALPSDEIRGISSHLRRDPPVVGTACSWVIRRRRAFTPHESHALPIW